MKIILFANTDWYLYNFRLPLAKKLIDEGNKVILLSPAGEFSERLLKAGYVWQRIELSRKGINPFQELRALIDLIIKFREIKPDLIHNFTIKCMLYGSLAGKITGSKKIINAVTGLGYLFSSNNIFTKLIALIIKPVYKILLKNTKVIFQNSSDQQYLIQHNVVKEKDSFLIPSSGVDVNKFIPQPDLIEPGLVILAARLLWDKGVGEFVESARLVKLKNPRIRFVLVGTTDPGNPTSISKEQIDFLVQEGIVEWWGWQEDMISIYQRAEIVCLPSYHEGLSKSLIEAAACGKPLIASDIPGCREVVHHGVNGLKVPKGDSLALAVAIQKMLDNPEKLEIMGKRSREIAVRDYSLEKVNNETIRMYNEMID